MNTSGFLFTLGLGMVTGAVVTSMLPQNCEVKKAVDSAATSLEAKAKQMVDSVGS